MVSNEEIMEILKVILEKVERLENIKIDHLTISEGTSFTINCGDDTPVGIETAETVIIKAGERNKIIIENAEEVQ